MGLFVQKWTSRQSIPISSAYPQLWSINCSALSLGTTFIRARCLAWSGGPAPISRTRLNWQRHPNLIPTTRPIFPRSEAWNSNWVVVLGSIRHRCLLPCCGRVDCKTVKRSPGIRDDLEAKDVVHARGSNGWRWWPCLEEKKTSGMFHVTAVALAYAYCYVVWIVQTIEKGWRKWKMQWAAALRFAGR